MNDGRLETRLGPLAYRSTGEGPTLVFFAGALANGDLWRDVVSGLADRYRCVTVDLPLGAHRWPLSAGADRSATSLARLLLDSIELLDVDPLAVVANDTAGGLLLLVLDEDHPALERIGSLVLTNCDNGDQFPPDALKRGSSLARRVPGLARTLLRAQLRTHAGRRKVVSSVASGPLDDDREASFFTPLRTDPRVAGDLVAAMAGFRPDLLVGAAPAIERLDRPVLIVWGESCEFFPMDDARQMASAFPSATLVTVPGAKTWVPVDDPATLVDAIAAFLPTVERTRSEGGQR
jgi:pimeloyl-ACP methyl ester carboxylesterase